MIVIKHGKSYNEIKCKHCKAVLGYTEKDMKKDFKTGEYLGEFYTIETTYITCPECNKIIHLKKLIDGKESLII
jgi:DNA-directed RNA polymerase subunit RPC12/RpoP